MKELPKQLSIRPSPSVTCVYATNVPPIMCQTDNYNAHILDEMVSRYNAHAELLEACKAAAIAHGNIETCDMPEWLEKIEAAIAKAEGRAQ